MTDLALVWNESAARFDIGMSGGDLLMDPGLTTAIYLSLLLDAPAQPGDVLPDPRSTDRRGWWGDAYLPPVNGKPDVYGSRLWLLRRAAQNAATLRAAEGYCLESLGWMQADGIVSRLGVTCSYPRPKWMDIALDFALTPAYAWAAAVPTLTVPWAFAA